MHAYLILFVLYCLINMKFLDHFEEIYVQKS